MWRMHFVNYMQMLRVWKSSIGLLKLNDWLVTKFVIHVGIIFRRFVLSFYYRAAWNAVAV